MMNLRNIEEADVKNKTVFLRADLDVPIENSKITDDSRLKAWLPTLEYLLKNQAEVIIGGHLGRPQKQFLISNFQFPKENEEFSLEPVVRWVSKRLSKTPFDTMYHRLVYDTVPIQYFKILPNLFILENLRFFKEEEENPSTSSGQAFAKKLASLAQVYVNDAFASSHRAHASIVGITEYLPSFAGLRLQREVGELSKVIENPKRPLAIIIGGAKIETKLPLVEKMHHFADFVLVGGEIAENDKILLKVQHEKIEGRKSALLVADLTENKKDITQKSAENFLQICQTANTIVWNGPMGLIEEEENALGTKILAEALSKLGSHKIVGGGDTVSYLNKINLLSKFNFVSTGGGAMLEFLSGDKLPGLIALQK